MKSNHKMSQVKPEMTVLDIISRHRQTEAVFRRYDEITGECICCNDLFETLAFVAQKHQLDITALVDDLEKKICEK
jgi:hypothetical protein